MRHITTALFLILWVVTMTSCGQPPGMEEGTWQLTKITVTSADTVVTIENTGLGRLMLVGGHYSQVWMRSDRLYSHPPTNLEKIDAYDTFDASAGPYTFVNSTLTLSPQIARDPGTVGEATVTNVTIDGDTMMRTRERPDPEDGAQTIQWTSTYMRVR